MKEKIVRRMKKYLFSMRSILVLILLVSFVLTGCTDMSLTSDTSSEEQYAIYNCDVKNMTFSTKVNVYKDGRFFGTVKGNILRWIEDPLTFYNKDDEKIAYAGDSYKFWGQDDHGIYVNDEFRYDMKGNFDFWGESYELYDEEKKLIATAEFNGSSTSGKLYNTDEQIIASYESGFLSSDFNIRIENTCTIEDEVIIMLFSSYYSDYAYDN